VFQNGAVPTSVSNPGSEIAISAITAPCQAAKGNFRHSAEIRRDREQWSGKRLGCPVACEEPVIRNPSGRYNGVVQQRQQDMTAAENKRAGAVKSIEQGERAFAGGGE